MVFLFVASPLPVASLLESLVWLVVVGWLLLAGCLLQWAGPASFQVVDAWLAVADWPPVASCLLVAT